MLLADIEWWGLTVSLKKDYLRHFNKELLHLIMLMNRAVRTMTDTEKRGSSVSVEQPTLVMLMLLYCNL